MEEQGAMALYKRYIRAFEEKDYEVIADACRTPFFVSSPVGTTVFEDRAALIDGFAHLRGSLDEDGYVRSRLNTLTFSKVATTTGTLFVDFERMNAADDAYFRGQALYLFQQHQTGLDITGIVVLDDATVSTWTD